VVAETGIGEHDEKEFQRDIQNRRNRMVAATGICRCIIRNADLSLRLLPLHQPGRLSLESGGNQDAVSLVQSTAIHVPGNGPVSWSKRDMDGNRRLYPRQNGTDYNLQLTGPAWRLVTVRRHADYPQNLKFENIGAENESR
jgi:hypothetical protein